MILNEIRREFLLKRRIPEIPQLIWEYSPELWELESHLKRLTKNILIYNCHDRIEDCCRNKAVCYTEEELQTRVLYGIRTFYMEWFPMVMKIIVGTPEKVTTLQVFLDDILKGLRRPLTPEEVSVWNTDYPGSPVDTEHKVEEMPYTDTFIKGPFKYNPEYEAWELPVYGC